MLGLCNLPESQIKESMFRLGMWLDLETNPSIFKLRTHIELVENDGEPMSLDLQQDGPLVDPYLKVRCRSGKQAQSIGGF